MNKSTIENNIIIDCNIFNKVLFSNFENKWKIGWKLNKVKCGLPGLIWKLILPNFNKMNQIVFINKVTIKYIHITDRNIFNKVLFSNFGKIWKLGWKLNKVKYGLPV